MPQIVNIITQPASEPVTLAEARLHLRIPDDLTADDSLITSLITAARRLCEANAKCTFVNTTFDVVEDSFPGGASGFPRQVRQFYSAYPGNSGGLFPGFTATSGGVWYSPRSPLVSVTSVKYLDTSGNQQTLDPTTYTVVPGSPGRLALAYGKVWPVVLPQVGAVTIRVVSGYGSTAASVPENVKAAIKLTLAHFYENREAVTVGQGYTTEVLPMAVDHLLGVETQWGYA